MKLLRSRLIVVAALATIICGMFIGVTYYRGLSPAHASTAAPSNKHMSINCELNNRFCSEVYDSYKVFGNYKYVGHDEPSTLFYSDTPGSGNQMQYELKLPSDPSPTSPMTRGKSYNFELHPAFWFGMAICDTQSYPELLSACTPDSNKNIVDPAVSPKHPGTAFMEMQFYPPGWAPWPAGNSCDATKWCAALNIDSLGLNPITGQPNNATCLNSVGEETVNFAFITLSGVPHAPANPVDATIATYTPNPKTDLFMNSGDEIITTMHDTANGLKIALNDLTSGQTGSMTASAANTFGQVQYNPNGSTCNNIPYNFHPMYSTSSEKTRVPWAAHSYNIAFADEIGHFDYCTSVSNGVCTGMEGIPGDHEATDSDDVGCFPASSSTLVQVSGCLGTNTGFDGVPYQHLWPDGNTKLRPTPIQYSSPLTGSGYNIQYSRMAFEADLPRIEGTCDRQTGVGCTLIPTTDDGGAAVFYPFFSITKQGSEGCVWQLGNHIPGSITDFGQNQEYGVIISLSYTSTGGHPITELEDYRQVLSKNPCQSGDVN
ncbi:MAG TPA: hypothetical protein VNG51_17550 [Ktedonobacteraceae bacterium]|nr:hypothetical protein [Ktedonobacteraceae bacterium]